MTRHVLQPGGHVQSPLTFLQWRAWWEPGTHSHTPCHLPDPETRTVPGPSQPFTQPIGYFTLPAPSRRTQGAAVTPVLPQVSVPRE